MTKEESQIEFYRIQTRYNKELLSLNRWYEEAMSNLEKFCKHDWEYHRDPSGGSDSGYLCNICQKMSKNDPN